MREMTVVVLLLLSGMSTLMAGNARIDVSCKDSSQEINQVEAEKPIRHNSMNWRKENKKAGHTFELKANNEWQVMEFTIIPEDDGIYVISLKGQYLKDKETGKMKPVEIYYDEIEVEGANLKNGSFEKVNEKNGKLANWWSSKTFAKENRHIDDESIASDGNKCVKVWHNNSIAQSVKVKKGVPVKIKAKVKSADASKSDL